GGRRFGGGGQAPALRSERPPRLGWERRILRRLDREPRRPSLGPSRRRSHRARQGPRERREAWPADAHQPWRRRAHLENAEYDDTAGRQSLRQVRRCLAYGGRVEIDEDVATEDHVELAEFRGRRLEEIVGRKPGDGADLVVDTKKSFV